MINSFEMNEMNADVLLNGMECCHMNQLWLQIGFSVHFWDTGEMINSGFDMEKLIKMTGIVLMASGPRRTQKSDS